MSPTYSSNIFGGGAPAPRKAPKARLRTTNRDDFGAEIYRDTLYKERSPAKNDLTATQNVGRAQRSTLEIRSRNEDQIDAETLSQYQNEPQSEQGRSQQLEPAAQQQETTEDPNIATFGQTDQNEALAAFQDTAEQAAGFEAAGETQQLADQAELIADEEPRPYDKGPEFYPRYDDEIFARTNFSPDKNNIVHTDKIPTGDEKYTREAPQDPVAVYEQDAKNQLIAIEKRVDDKNLKATVLGEEKAMLDDLVDQEESKRLESKLRREYRRRIDNYHINVTDNKFYDEKVLRVVKTRAKATDIKEEAARVQNERDAETQFIKDRKAQYKAELDKLADQKRREKDDKKRTHYEAER